MENPFSPDSGKEVQIPRIPRDLSKMRLFTAEFGKLMPCECLEVYPGDTISIKDVQLAIQGMPTYFPVQTPIKVSVSYYYCRNRQVYDDWEDFIFKTKDVEGPWVRLDYSRAKTMISTGSLGDYLGVATTINAGQVSDSNQFTAQVADGLLPERILDFNGVYDYFRSKIGTLYWNMVTSTSPDPCYIEHQGYSNFVSLRIGNIPADENIFLLVFENSDHLTSNDFSNIVRNSYLRNVFYGKFNQDTRIFEQESSRIQLSDVLNDDSIIVIVPFHTSQGGFEYENYRYSFSVNSVTDATDDSVIANNIYVGNSPRKKLTALPFRHYEMISNYYYRNDKNNPYVLNGEPQYNEFIPSHAGGADDNVYNFHYRNFELDMFTSAVQSPQFGEAPLVGLTYQGDGDIANLEFESADGQTTYSARVALDGTKIVGITDFSDDIPSANLRKLQEMVNYGISINDFRVTNAFQRFKENMMRKGLRYRNQLASHIGVSVDYPDIQIPEYIGGFSGTMNSVRNENMAASEYANLGDFNGSLFGNFTLSNPISRYINEHGFIIGIMSIVPIPVYPQMTEPYMCKTDAFDYYQTEFGKIGFVPLPYSVVMPLQNGPDQSPDDIFGYQKYAYEYMRRVDSVHGDFKTTLRNFVCARNFVDRPLLSEDFTQVHPQDFNDIFITENIADKYGSNAKFMCKMYSTVHGNRVMPDIGTPSLE